MTAKVRNFEIYMQTQAAKYKPRRFCGGHGIKRIYTRLPKWFVHIGIALYIQWSYILNIISWLVQTFTKRKFRTHLFLALLLAAGHGGYCFYMIRELSWKPLGMIFLFYWVALIILFIFRNKIKRWNERTWEKVIRLQGNGSSLRGYVVINSKFISEITPEMEAEIRAARQSYPCWDMY